MLWPDQPLHRSRRLLSDALWRARRSLSGPEATTTTLLLIAGDTVAFQPTPEVRLDIGEFERLADDADANDLPAAGVATPNTAAEQM